jgi:hypothetical protein
LGTETSTKGFRSTVVSVTGMLGTIWSAKEPIFVHHLVILPLSNMEEQLKWRYQKSE